MQDTESSDQSAPDQSPPAKPPDGHSVRGGSDEPLSPVIGTGDDFDDGDAPD